MQQHQGRQQLGVFSQQPGGVEREAAQVMQQFHQQLWLPPEPRQPPLQQRQQAPAARAVQAGHQGVPQQQHSLHQHQAGRGGKQGGQAVAALRLQCRQQGLQQGQVGAAAAHDRLQLALQGPLLLSLAGRGSLADRRHELLNRSGQASQPGRIRLGQRRLQQPHQHQPALARILQGRTPLQPGPAQGGRHSQEPGLAAVEATHQQLQQAQRAQGICPH